MTQPNHAIALQVCSTPNTKVSKYYNINITNYAFTVRLPQTEERASTGQTHTNKGASKRQGRHMHGGNNSNNSASASNGDWINGGQMNS